MKWIIRNYRDYYVEALANLRAVPFYAVQGHAKKGGRRKY